jgi:hypothetical protein
VTPMELPDHLYTFLAAWLFFVITNSSKIIILAKSNSHRSAAERKEVERGLRRAVFIELLVFVPASAGLVLLLAPLATNSRVLQESVFFNMAGSRRAFYALLGLISYGFPFETVRYFVTRRAVKILKAALSADDEPSNNNPRKRPGPRD